MTDQRDDERECKVCGRTPPFDGGTRCQRLDCGLIEWTAAQALADRSSRSSPDDLAGDLNAFAHWVEPTNAKIAVRLREAATALSATRAVDEERNTFFAFIYDDGSIWTDDIFETEERAQKFAKGPDADLVEGATLKRVVIRVSDRTAKP